MPNPGPSYNTSVRADVRHERMAQTAAAREAVKEAYDADYNGVGRQSLVKRILTTLRGGRRGGRTTA